MASFICFPHPQGTEIFQSGEYYTLPRAPSAIIQRTYRSIKYTWYNEYQAAFHAVRKYNQFIRLHGMYIIFTWFISYK